MCSRYACFTSPADLARLFGTLDPAPRPQRSWNIAPGHDALIVRLHPQTRQRHLDALQWGHGLRVGHNALAETIADAELFGDLMAGRRGLVPADAFYQWAHLPSGKQPFAIARHDRRPLAFAGLWTAVRALNGSPLRTFTILTCPANATLAALSQRMPVVLDEAAWPLWLGEVAGDPLSVLGPAADETLRVWCVSRKLNQVRNDGAELLEHVFAFEPGDPFLEFQIRGREIAGLQSRLSGLSRRYDLAKAAADHPQAQRARALRSTVLHEAELLQKCAELFDEFARRKAPRPAYRNDDPARNGFGLGQQIGQLGKAAQITLMMVQVWPFATAQALDWPEPSILDGPATSASYWGLEKQAYVRLRDSDPALFDEGRRLSLASDALMRGVAAKARDLSWAAEGICRIARATLGLLETTARTLLQDWARPEEDGPLR
jgi:putative SOS response-associated peptidase YedK